MGRLTRCNRCTLDAILEHGQRFGNQVTVVTTGGRLGGYDVYEHPIGTSIHKLSKRWRDSYWRAWLWALGKKCECG